MKTLDSFRAALADRYQIVREIGTGGMATVYLAHDLRHERDVAVKLLKPELGAVLGPERFLSEIRVTARLQHPNLLPLFDSGECEGQLYYVMPFVEGESLRKRLERERQLPVREAVRLACAVAGALDYAHRHGVIHRDLKPENILLQENQPLVADFGIALAVSNAGGERVTQTGLSLGTPQYMSPEQATGERIIDGRADIYSLGAVLYEMLTGEPPHTGATVQAIVARVLTETPRSTRVHRPAVPPHIDAAVAQALEKVPADRFQSARELAEALEDESRVTATTRPSAAEPAGASFARARFRRAVPWAIAGLAVAAAVTTIGMTRWRSAAEASRAEPIRFAITATADERISPTDIAISPDGRVIVYSGTSGATRQIFVRTADDIIARPIGGTNDAELPFFSPDGRWVGFFQNDELKRIPIQGGGTVTIARGLQLYRPAWGTANELVVPTVAFTRQRSGLSLISPTGGKPRTAFVSDTAHRERLDLPVVLDDRRTVLFRSSGPGGTEDDWLGIGRLGSGRYDTLDVLVNAPVGYAEGHAIVIQGNGTRFTLVAVPVTLGSRKASGDAITLVENIASSGGAQLSRNGTLLFSTGANNAQLTSVDGRDSATVVAGEPREYLVPRLSPDGSRIAFVEPGATTGELWVLDRRSGTTSRVATFAHQPVWTPDGRRLLFARLQTAGAGLWSMPVDGSAVPEQLRPILPAGLGAPLAPTIAPDGKTVAFVATSSSQRRNVYWFVPGSNDSAHVWLGTEYDEGSPSFSPDGRWIAYLSDETGRYEVYIRPFPGPGGRVQVSSDGGLEPSWSADGRSVYYRKGTSLIAAELEGGTAPVVRRRGVAFTLRNNSQTNSVPTYSVTADGRHVVEARPIGGDVKLVVVYNWFTELRRKIAEAR